MSRVKLGITSLLQPRAVLVGLAVFNFSVFFVATSRIRGFMFCFGGRPWYAFEDFWYVPLVLLIAAVSLYFRSWWSHLVALGSCLFALYRLVVMVLIETEGPDHLWLYGLWAYLNDKPGLVLQFVFAAALSFLALRGFIKTSLNKLQPLA